MEIKDVNKIKVVKLSNDTFSLSQPREDEQGNMNVSALLKNKENLELQLKATNDLIAKCKEAGVSFPEGE